MKSTPNNSINRTSRDAMYMYAAKQNNPDKIRKPNRRVHIDVIRGPLNLVSLMKFCNSCIRFKVFFPVWIVDAESTIAIRVMRSRKWRIPKYNRTRRYVGDKSSISLSAKPSVVQFQSRQNLQYKSDSGGACDKILAV
ncbi:hypothetical protein CsSME_00005060 [Camellia sinensis var. sinensis]